MIAKPETAYFSAAVAAAEACIGKAYFLAA